MFKRLFDILLSVIFLFLAILPIILIAFILLLVQGRPILFKQLRPGFKERPFELYKFRTMLLDDNQYLAQNMQTLDEDRLTSIGRWLRSTSLDELPSIFNVLKGDMSIVGPRPLLMHYLDLYSKEQRKRHDVKPGITGWTQVKGRNSLTWPERFKLDIWYTENQSLFLDIKIIFLTFYKVIKKEGIASSGEATGEPFFGQKD